jgi:hypothetical protein
MNQVLFFPSIVFSTREKYGAEPHPAKAQGKPPIAKGWQKTRSIGQSKRSEFSRVE